MTTSIVLLAELNAFRASEGKEPFKDWRKARHMPLLEAYRSTVVETGEPEVTVVDSLTALADLMKPSSTEKVREQAKGKSYKEVANYEKSRVENPVKFVHNFLDTHPGLTRKEAVVALTESFGVNYSTARTQYQRWYSAKK